jgi:hypothetical protein
MDAGPVWASRDLPAAPGEEVEPLSPRGDEAATRAVLQAVERFAAGGFVPTPVDDADPAIRGRARPPMRQADRAIDWQHDDTARILARLNAADGFPGVADELFGEPCRCSTPGPKTRCAAAKPGDVIAWRETAILRATVDGAVWIGHLRRRDAGRLAQAAGDAGLCCSNWRRFPKPRSTATSPSCRQNLAGHPLRRSRAGGFPALRLLQRRHEHPPVPAPAGGLPVGAAAAGQGAGADGRPRLLVERHPPRQHRSGRVTG